MFRIYLIVMAFWIVVIFIAWTIGFLFLVTRQLWRILRWGGNKLWFRWVDARVSRAI